MADKNEGALAGKHPDMGIHGIEGQDNEGHVKGSKQGEFNERAAQEAQKREDENELNRTDARDAARDPGRV
jgi:hypothetical protein